MKKILIILVLFFSFSVFAGDNLTGMKLFCKKSFYSGKGLVLVGFDFTNKNEVIFYYNTSRRLSLYSSTRLYKASTSQIRIKIPKGSTFDTIGAFYNINRRGIHVDQIGSDILDFHKDYCKFTDESLEILFEDALL